jgi:GTP-binding protein HflX
MYDTQAQLTERALLVGLEKAGHDRWAVQDSLEELRDLTQSAGAEVVELVSQKRDAPSAPTFIGRGKAAELAAICREKNANTVIFDDDLSPAQVRNLEEILGENIKILDRTELILDIFAQRAHTKEGKIQVELAQLQYLLPRLTGLWTHLSRQRGGVGTRGPGEQQLEVDRRRILEKISRLRRDLDEVRKNRRIVRSGRQRLHWPAVSIIGYTNSGKSTLLNALSGAHVFTADKLFATLDPTTRRVRLPDNQNILLTDTVGFLRKLPHHLVESFKATLEEAVEAELLVHVADVSHPQVDEQMRAVDDVLNMIGATGKPTVVALNKIDKIGGETAPIVSRLVRDVPNSVPISAKLGTNLDDLLDEISNQLKHQRISVTLSIPHERADVISKVYRTGRVTARELENGQVILHAEVPRQIGSELQPYVIGNENSA